MKKFLFFGFLLCAVIACEKPNQNGSTEEPEKVFSEVGVWESGEHFLSFSSDGFCSAYLSDSFIDSGSYQRDKNVIVCSNTYFNRETKYTISSITDSDLRVSYSFTDTKGKTWTGSLSFTKSSKKATSSNHILVNKSYSINSSYTGTITYKYTTNNSGTRTASSGSARQYPLRIFYVFLDNQVYMQYFTSGSGGNAIPTIGGWTNQADNEQIFKYQLEFSGSGDISRMY